MNTPSVPLPTLGFIGLGHMGGPMAVRLAQAGYPLVVFDIAADAVQTLVSRGARAAASAREVGDQAQIVFFCLPRPDISIAVAGELRGSKACRVLVEMSTVGRSALTQIAQASGDDIELLDCPISGGVAKAVSGDLSAIVAGPEALVSAVRPCLEAVASHIFVVGDRAVVGERAVVGSERAVVGDRTSVEGPTSGPTVAFNVRRQSGELVGYAEVTKLAALHGPPIQLRGGCCCNPGGCQSVLGLTDAHH
jgi:hypothetical protein